MLEAIKMIEKFLEGQTFENFKSKSRRDGIILKLYHLK